MLQVKAELASTLSVNNKNIINSENFKEALSKNGNFPASITKQAFNFVPATTIPCHYPLSEKNDNKIQQHIVDQQWADPYFSPTQTRLASHIQAQPPLSIDFLIPDKTTYQDSIYYPFTETRRTSATAFNKATLDSEGNFSTTSFSGMGKVNQVLRWVASATLVANGKYTTDMPEYTPEIQGTVIAGKIILGSNAKDDTHIPYAITSLLTSKEKYENTLAELTKRYETVQTKFDTEKGFVA